MKKLLLFLFAAIATLGLHAEKVALVAPDVTYSGDAPAANVLNTSTSGNNNQNAKSGTIADVIDFNFSSCGYYSKAFRFYGNSTITFTPKEGYKITAIKFDINGSYKNLDNYSGPGSFDTNTYTWTGDTDQSVSFSCKSSQTRANYIEITYEEGMPDPVDFILPSEADVFLNETTNILPEKHPENITWTSADENIATVEDGVIFGKAVGFTTISANWDASQLWNAGSATIEVFVSKSSIYSLITSVDEIEAGQKYAIVQATSTGYVAASTASSNFLNQTEISVKNNSFQPTPAVLIFTLEDTGDNSYYIHLTNYEGKGEYLSSNSSSKTNFSKVAKDDADKATISFDNNGHCKIALSGVSGRLIQYNGSADFRNYSTSTTEIYLYKRVAVTLTEQDNYRPRWKDQTLQLGNQYSTYKINLGLEGDYPDVTFTSSDESVATVSGNVVTAKGVGSAIITGSWEESDSWFADSRAFNVSVIDPKKEPTLTFQHEIIHGKVGVGVAAQAAIYDGDGVITYESSNTSAVTVDTKTGMIRPNDVKRVGKVFITANATGTAGTNPASASYILYIDAVPTATDVENATFDFTKNNYGMYEFTSENCTDENNIEYYEATVNQREGVDHNHVMIVNENGIILNFLDREDDIDGYRLWKDLAGENYDEVINYLCLYDCHFSITAPEGCTLEYIEFTDHSDRLGEISADCGSFSPSNDDEDAIWNAGDKAISSVEFTSTGKETHFGKIKVTLRDNTAGMKNPNLTFGERVYSVTAGDIVEVVGAETVANVDINYSIDNTDENDYLIEPEANVLQIMLADPGVYTLRATSEATDEYVAGMAIARIDVFPAISVEYDENNADLKENVLLLPAEGGYVNFTEVGGPVSLLVDENDGNGEYTHDGSDFTIEENKDLHLTYTPQYAETFKHTTTNHLYVYTVPAIPTYSNDGGTKHTYSWPEGQEFYYQLSTQNGEQARAFRANDLDGWTKAEGNTLTIDTEDHNLAAGQMLNIKTKTVKQTINGPIETETYFNMPAEGGMSGIAGVETDSNADVRYFNLEGVEMHGDLAPGLYIRLTSGNAQKVNVK